MPDRLGGCFICGTGLSPENSPTGVICDSISCGIEFIEFLRVVIAKYGNVNHGLAGTISNLFNTSDFIRAFLNDLVGYKRDIVDQLSALTRGLSDAQQVLASEKLASLIKFANETRAALEECRIEDMNARFLVSTKRDNVHQ